MNTMIYILLLVSLSSTYCISLSSYDATKVRQKSRLIMDYNWPEPDPNIKKFPHERNCHYYYQAEGEDIFTIRKCHEGEIFDYHRHECTKKSDGQCFSDHYGKTKMHDHIHSKFRKLFKCPTSNGNFPDIFDCRKYFHCINGKPKHRQCHSNKLFDKLKRHCMIRRNALCADITDVSNIDKKNYNCPRPHGLFADPNVCSMYYECFHRKPTLKICVTGQLFDATKRRCVSKEQVNCGYKQNPYEKTANVLIRSSTLNQAETSTETSSLPEKTHSDREIVKTGTTVNKRLITASTISDNISSSSTANQPRKSTTNEPEHEPTKIDSENVSTSGISSKKTASLLSSSNSSTLNDTEATSLETSSLPEKTHAEKKIVKTSVTVGKLFGSESTVSGNISSLSPTSQHEKSTTTHPQHESTQADSKYFSTSRSSSDINHTETPVKTKPTLSDKPNPMPCTLETCIVEDGIQLRCLKANGVHPYNKDKSRFIQCDNFKIYIRQCPGHQIFDVKQNTCTLLVPKFNNVM